jgi:hypothetical protein
VLVGTGSTANANAVVPAALIPVSGHLLPGGGHGRTAVKALGAHLGDAARLNGLSASRFTNVLDTDSTAHLDRDGRLYYEEPAPQIAMSATAAEAATAAVRPAIPAVDVATVPALHSRATSTHKIFLDFDGATVSSSSAWTQATTNKLTPGTYGGFDLDGDASTYSPAEVAYIEKVWRIVSEKYSPYDVDVTTVDPGVAGYTRSGGSDVDYGDHVVITSDTRPGNQICPGCAGIAYINTFNVVGNAAYDPVWVFASQDFGSAQLTAHDAAHEIGHSFGLTHDGTNTLGANSYYAGQGSWAPIMGLTDQNAIYQFSKGEYADANNTQDDLAIIAADGDSGLAGSLLLPDDYPNTGDAPYALGAEPSYALDGVISNAADSDLFSISRTCTSDIVATATGIGAGQSLDMKVDILSTSNAVLATANPASGEDTSTQADGDTGYLPTGLDATATLAAPTAGTTYEIRVEGVGDGNPLTTGYSNYGSIGQYHLKISGCGGTSGTAPGAPTGGSVSLTPRTTTATIHWAVPSSEGDSAITGYSVTGAPTAVPTQAETARSATLTGLVPGTTYQVKVAATNSTGGTGAALTIPVRAQTFTPAQAPGLTLTASGRTMEVRWTQPANPGNAAFTTWRVTILGRNYDTPYGDGNTGLTFSNVPTGTYSVNLQLLATADSATAVPSVTHAITIGPGAPKIGTASSGARGGHKTAVARWSAGAANGNVITSYKVYAYKLNSHGKVVKTFTSSARSASSRSYTWALPAGRYKFRVVANTKIGASPASAYSKAVTSR